MSQETLDIVNLIQNNTIVGLSSISSSNLIEKIKKTFTDNQQQLFVASFFTYLNYNSKNDFVIDLDNIWKWLGFSRKDHCKTVLEKHFLKDNDYIIQKATSEVVESCDDKTTEIFAPEVAEAKKDGRGGNNKEKILMTVNTFKKLCLKAGTKRADEIHEYYINLEEIIQETISEEAIELKNILQKTTQELEEKELELEKKDIIIKRKEKQLKELSKKTSIDYIYVAINEGVSNLSKIGITENIIRRNDNHLSSNPGFKYVYTYQSKNNKLIESCIKSFLSPFVYNKAEWYSIPQEDLVYIVEFFIEIFDKNNGHEDPKNITDFIKRLRQKSVIVKHKDELIPRDLYSQFFKECIEFQTTVGHIPKLDNKYKCTLLRLQERFDQWLTDNNYSFAIKNNAGNYLEKYKTDIKDYIQDTYNKSIETINLISGKHNMKMSSYLGYVGFRVADDFAKCYYTEDIYKRFINGCLVVDNKSSTTKKEIAECFDKWLEQNQIESSLEKEVNSRVSTLFYAEITEAIQKLTGIISSKKVTNKRYSGYPGFKGIALSL
jgi:hypothetical protein